MDNGVSIGVLARVRGPRAFRMRCAASALFALSALPAIAHADTIWLEDGSVVKGEILEITDDKLTVDTGFADEIEIDTDEIDSLQSTQQLTITFEDETERSGYLRKLPDGTVYLGEEPPAPAGETTPPVTADATDAVDISKIHRLEQTKTYFWYNANIDLGVNGAQGNTESTNANISGAIRPRFGKNHVDVTGQANKQDSDNETTASNWRVLTTYTRQLTTRWGATGFASFENDEKQDLSLRSTIGAGARYNILDPDPTLLHVVLGLAYVKENFEECDNPTPGDADCPDDEPPLGTADGFVPSRSFGAIRWTLDYEQDIFSDDYKFYHNHALTIGVIQESQFIALTTTGFEFELIGDLSLKLELQFDYNNDPVGDTKKEDIRYLVKLSYDLEGDQNDWIQ